MTRNGKIARLPGAIREDLNRRLFDGGQARLLLQWLHGLPEVQDILRTQFGGKLITKTNLSQWKTGGYAAWEIGERMAENVKQVMEGTSTLQSTAKEGLTDRMALMLAAIMATQIHRFESMEDGVEKAKLWRELRISLMALKKCELAAARLEMERERHGKPGNAKEDRGLTPAQRRQRMKEILGLGEGYDGLKNPELTNRPLAEEQGVQASTSQYK